MAQNHNTSDQHNSQNCPLNDKSFIERMARVENELKDIRENRVKKDDSIYKVITEIKANLLNKEEQINELRVMHKEFMDLMVGIMGRPGLVAESLNLQSRVKDLEDWKRDSRSFIAGVVFISSILSGILVTAFGYLVHWIKT